MQHTLVAVFELRSEAEHAMDELLAGGFSRNEVQISKADATGQTDSLTGRPTSADEQPHDEGFGAGIRHFFRDIFGTDASVHTQKYSDAVARGHHVLIVNAADEPEIERAADIVERHGPVDIDEKVAEWGGGASVAQPESMRMGGAGAMQQSAAASAQSASLMERHGEPNLFQQQSLQDEAPMGTTYQEPMGDSGNLSLGISGAALQGAASPDGSLQDAQQGTQQGSQQRDSGSSATTSIPVIDDSAYRSHWSSHYAHGGGIYDDYWPAYSYGSEMARSGKYRGRDWDQVEGDLRSDWDTRHGNGGSTWEQFKAAVRHGWERITS